MNNMEKKLALLGLLYGMYVVFVLGDFDVLRARTHPSALIVIIISLSATVVMLLLVWKISLSGRKSV